MIQEVIDQAVKDGDIVPVSWKCLYHRNFCHNPLDCDLVRTYRFKDSKVYTYNQAVAAEKEGK